MASLGEIAGWTAATDAGSESRMAAGIHQLNWRLNRMRTTDAVRTQTEEHMRRLIEDGADVQAAVAEATRHAIYATANLGR